MPCLNVLYMHLIYVGVHCCNHDNMTCGYPQVFFWIVFFFSIPIHHRPIIRSYAVWVVQGVVM
jgi:hypothetical protein